MMKVKVCGLKYADNISGIMNSKSDYIGFIFYANSLRFAGHELVKDHVRKIGENVLTVGVFVNAKVEEIVVIYRDYGLSYVQLHGDESVDECALLKKRSVAVIKAFQVDTDFNFSSTLAYSPYADFFLFDTAGAQRGGTGRKFDWSLLSEYNGTVPFILSGGIGPEDIAAIGGITHPLMHGVDVNSRFELSPGIKDVNLVSEFIKSIHNAVRD